MHGNLPCMAISLDPRKAHLVRRHGDIFAIYTWMDDTRTLILIPAMRKGAPWFCIKEDVAYKYDDVAYLAKMSAKAAEVLGMDESTSTWRKIATIIVEGLPDLIEMPSAPLPEMETASHGEMQLRANGELLSGTEIRFEKEAGVVL